MKSKYEIFGILNITPDSFSDGGLFFDTKKAINHAEKMFSQGADYIDIGGQSTRPQASEIFWREEWQRIEPALKKLLKLYPEKISLDTKHFQTAQKFLALGGRILNDVSGFQDCRMQELVVEFEPTVIINHFPGKTIQEVHEQKIRSMKKVADDLLARREELIQRGFSDQKIILDPGIGFGKTMELNWELLKFSSFVPEQKVMIGHSRKRFLGTNRFEKNSNLYAAQIALDAGAQYLRVHDVELHENNLQRYAQ
jgi:dihydropteroate synthase